MWGRWATTALFLLSGENPRGFAEADDLNAALEPGDASL